MAALSGNLDNIRQAQTATLGFVSTDRITSSRLPPVNQTTGIGKELVAKQNPIGIVSAGATIRPLGVGASSGGAIDILV